MLIKSDEISFKTKYWAKIGFSALLIYAGIKGKNH
jgi:hypothetical protein